MRNFIIPFLFAILFPATVSAQNTDRLDDIYMSVAANTLTGYIRPAFQTFREDAFLLSSNIRGLCKKPNTDHQAAVGQAFERVVLSFSRIEILRFGPLVKDNRFERLFFWPDRKGRALKRIQRALNERNADLLESDNLRGKSVAIQGLGGLEYLLYGSDAGEIVKDNFRCGFATAISENIASISAELAHEWSDETGYSALLLTPSKNNATYRTPKEVGIEILSVLVNGTETIKALKLKPVIGPSPESAKPRRSPFWRSALTLKVISSNLIALSDYENVSGLLNLDPNTPDWLKGATTFEYKNALSRLSEIDVTIKDAVIHPIPRSKLTYIQTVMGNLRTLYTEEIGPSLNLSAGFNALDGD